MREMAARAVIEASTRLRRAVYHHTFRLGTLAFRALGPSEAVTIFTRHVEAVHDGLYTWITVMFREPVKFGLLLAFALVINFWLALVGLSVLHGELGVAGAITLAVALVSLYWPLTAWLAHRRPMRRAREAAAQLFAFLDRPGEVGQAGDAEFLQPLSRQLEFDNV